MAVGDTHMFPSFLTQVLTQLSFQSHRLLFSHASAEVRGENMPERKFTSTGSRTDNHQVMSHPGTATVIYESCSDNRGLTASPWSMTPRKQLPNYGSINTFCQITDNVSAWNEQTDLIQYFHKCIKSPFPKNMAHIFVSVCLWFYAE